MAEQPCPAYVLAGGRSSRMGTDKARVEITPGVTLLEAAVRSVDGGFSSWTVVADRPDKFADLGFRTIADHRPHQGPLGGILRACDDAGQGIFFVISCDRIGLRRSWVEDLWALMEDRRASAACFEFKGRIEPLFGWYRAELSDKLRSFLDGGDRAVWRFLESVDAATIVAPSRWEETISVNTPQQLEHARAWISQNG